MKVLIVVLLVAILMALLGILVPTLYAAVLGIVGLAPKLFIVAGVALAMLVLMLAWHAAQGRL